MIVVCILRVISHKPAATVIIVIIVYIFCASYFSGRS
jgi:hypothetical protein